jgi:hypothetical protein
MKNLIATLLLLPTLAFSQNNGIQNLKFDAQCVDARTLAVFLAEFGEKSIFRGVSSRETRNGVIENITVFYFNRETMSWTMVERIASDTFCVIGTGTNIEFLPTDNQTRQNRKGS